MLHSEAIKSLRYYKSDGPYVNMDVFCFDINPNKRLYPSSIYFYDFEVKEVSVDLKVTELYGVSEGSCIMDYEFFLFKNKISILING